MNRKSSFVITIIVLAFVLVACGQTSKTQEIVPMQAATQTATPMPPTEPPTLTPSPVPTIIPTPLGGRAGLLLHEQLCIQDSTTKKYTCTQKIYFHDILTQKSNLLFEGYTLAGISPDGKKFVMEKKENEKTDLFIVDLAKPEEPTVLYENVFYGRSVWFADTDWIGFIAKKDGKFQVFIIHPDGTNLTQVTNSSSSSGAVSLEKTFNGGVFWGEGTVNSNGSTDTKRYKWTKLDGTETTYINFDKVFPSGKFVMIRSLSQGASCWGCKFDLIDIATSERKEVDLLLPDKDAAVKNVAVRVQPLSDDKWLVHVIPTMADLDANVAPINYIFSSDGTILLNFADLPHSNDPLVDDYYRLVGGDGGNLSGQRLSPDGNLLLIERRTLTNASLTPDPTSTYQNSEISYYVLNLQTFEVQQLPGLLFTNKDGVRTGVLADAFYWIEMP